MRRLLLACLFSSVTMLNGAAPAEAAELRVVGVLGNTAGLGLPPVPYPFYTGIALDLRERLWLVGATSGLVCCDQDGKCLAVVPLREFTDDFAPHQSRNAVWSLRCENTSCTNVAEKRLAQEY